VPSRTIRAVFHVVTVHWRSDAWIVPQLQYLRRHLPAGTRVYAALHGIDRKWYGEFDWAGELDGTHAEKLNQLAAIVSREAAPDDHLVFVDGDAFPIATVDPSLLATVPLVASAIRSRIRASASRRSRVGTRSRAIGGRVIPG
jgi:hypothetical protein